MDPPAHAMRVPLSDISAQNQSLADELRAAIDEVVNTSQFILGPTVERFERNFANYLGASHCVGVNNGTSALQLALIASGVQARDEVITTPLSWPSTAWAISYARATPVFVDVSQDRATLDPNLVERAITPKTRAILAVHLYGQPADVQALRELAERFDLAFIEDVAQAHGAVVGGRRVGTFGKASCFSFYPSKNLGAFGEAGAVVTNDPSMAQRVRGLRDHAQTAPNWHVEIGYNARMEALQGAVLDVKLKQLDRWNALRARHAEQYRGMLAQTDNLQLPSAAVGTSHVWHQFVVRVPHAQRDRVREQLAESGVATGVHYPRLIPAQPAYQSLGYRSLDFPVADQIARSCISLPVYPELTQEQVAFVAEQVQRVMRSIAGTR